MCFEVKFGFKDFYWRNTMSPEPNPIPESPKPNPIEIDTGGLHSKPEVDYGSIPARPPLEPNPEVPPEREPEKEIPAPDTEPK